jgi:predicted nucleotidyltransferase component of viral defense system
MSLSRAQAIECFHLAFLNVLPSHARREVYVVKGGANLRYFFHSHRYSEDIDFDAVAGEGWKLEEQVDAALAAKALELQLRRHGIVLSDPNKSKQTGTTRRWKPQLLAGFDNPISTRVEFRFRSVDERFDLESVDESVVKPYGLLRPSLQRYRATAALEQKIDALALRAETQARDVFDLDWLFRNYRDAVDASSINLARAGQAAETCAILTYDSYQSQVVPFLDPPIAELYGSEDAWVQMQTAVFEELTTINARD